MRRVWTADERRVVIDNYGALGAEILAGHLGRSADSVSSQARRHGLAAGDYRRRQGRTRAELTKTVNIRFFDTETPATAFVLGYIWACGGIKTKHRKVLRIACPYGKTAGMRQVLELLESKHQIQTYENCHVVEICNSHLVERLVDRFGFPPGRRRDGHPPRLSDRHLSRFAAGHLLATGSRNDIHVRWQGHASVLAWLGEKIALQAHVPPPERHAATARVSIRWGDLPSVRAIGAWLDRVH